MTFLLHFLQGSFMGWQFLGQLCKRFTGSRVITLWLESILQGGYENNSIQIYVAPPIKYFATVALGIVGWNRSYTSVTNKYIFTYKYWKYTAKNNYWNNAPCTPTRYTYTTLPVLLQKKTVSIINQISNNRNILYKSVTKMSRQMFVEYLWV